MTHNHLVGGSSPPGPTILAFVCRVIGDRPISHPSSIASGVVPGVAKLISDFAAGTLDHKVAGSIPAASSQPPADERRKPKSRRGEFNSPRPHTS